MKSEFNLAWLILGYINLISDQITKKEWQHFPRKEEKAGRGHHPKKAEEREAQKGGTKPPPTPHRSQDSIERTTLNQTTNMERGHSKEGSPPRTRGSRAITPPRTRRKGEHHHTKWVERAPHERRIETYDHPRLQGGRRSPLYFDHPHINLVCNFIYFNVVQL